ncbi:hypothetical protein ACUT7J_003314 [Vibrio cholerae]
MSVLRGKKLSVRFRSIGLQTPITVREIIGALNVALASRDVRIESKQDFDDFLQQVCEYQEQDE